MDDSRLDRVDLAPDQIPSRWYNVIPDLPCAPAEFLDPGILETDGLDVLRAISSRE